MGTKCCCESAPDDPAVISFASTTKSSLCTRRAPRRATPSCDEETQFSPADIIETKVTNERGSSELSVESLGADCHGQSSCDCEDNHLASDTGIDDMMETAPPIEGVRSMAVEIDDMCHNSETPSDSLQVSARSASQYSQYSLSAGEELDSETAGCHRSNCGTTPRGHSLSSTTSTSVRRWPEEVTQLIAMRTKRPPIPVIAVDVTELQRGEEIPSVLFVSSHVMLASREFENDDGTGQAACDGPLQDPAPLQDNLCPSRRSDSSTRSVEQYHDSIASISTMKPPSVSFSSHVTVFVDNDGCDDDCCLQSDREDYSWAVGGSPLVSSTLVTTPESTAKVRNPLTIEHTNNHVHCVHDSAESLQTDDDLCVEVNPIQRLERDVSLDVIGRGEDCAAGEAMMVMVPLIAVDVPHREQQAAKGRRVM